MKVWVGQIYGEPGASFPFSYIFQQRLSAALTELAESSGLYLERFGADFELMFRMSARSDSDRTEVRGPSVYRKARDVEYVVFLPFSIVMESVDPPRTAIQLFIESVCDVFDSLEISTSRLRESYTTILDELCADPAVLAEPPWDEHEHDKQVRQVFAACLGQAEGKEPAR